MDYPHWEGHSARREFERCSPNLSPTCCFYRSQRGAMSHGYLPLPIDVLASAEEDFQRPSIQQLKFSKSGPSSPDRFQPP
jgi:hypothetical protein